MKKFIIAALALTVLAGCTKQEARFVDKVLRDVDRLEQRKKDNERKDRYMEILEEKHDRKRK